jgi:Periplasmic component of the Tol biopolymer transport system
VSPVWSADGQRVAYSSWQPDVGTFNLFLVRADGSGEPQRLTTSKNRQNPIAWHPGGKYLLFSEDSHATGGDLMLLPIDVRPRHSAGGSPQPFLTTSANEVAGQFSPDGKWVAYTSDESGRNEVYVRPFPSGAGRWQVSTEGAEWIEWRRNGHRLFYGTFGGRGDAGPVPHRGRDVHCGEASSLAAHPAGAIWVDPSADGNRAIVIRSEDARTESVVLMVNFFEHLRRKLQGGG